MLFGVLGLVINLKVENDVRCIRHSELGLIQGKSPLTLLWFPGVCKSQNTDVKLNVMNGYGCDFKCAYKLPVQMINVG